MIELTQSLQDSGKEKPTTASYRNTLLEDIYKKESSKIRQTSFKDGELLIVLPRVQIVKSMKMVEMYNTSTEIYYIMEDYLVLFAHENGLQMLSDSLCFTFKQAELEKARRRKCSTEEDQNRKQTRIETLSAEMSKLKKKNVINLKQIKNEYTQRFIETTQGQ